MQTFRIHDEQRAHHVNAASQLAALCQFAQVPASAAQMLDSGRPAAGSRPSAPSVWQVAGRTVRIEHVGASHLPGLAA